MTFHYAPVPELLLLIPAAIIVAVCLHSARFSNNAMAALAAIGLIAVIM